jgi:hypothetical protein
MHKISPSGRTQGLADARSRISAISLYPR